MNCSLHTCQRILGEDSPVKLELVEAGGLSRHQFCSLAHLGAWLITRLDKSARNLVSILGTSEGRKMAVKFLADKVL